MTVSAPRLAPPPMDQDRSSGAGRPSGDSLAFGADFEEEGAHSQIKTRSKTIN